MASGDPNNPAHPTKIGAVRRVMQVLSFERKEISAIYFYVIFGGLVQLSLPLGIQSIISFVMGGAISTSLVILIVLVIIGVFVNGLLQVNTMKIIEKIQQQLFVRYSFRYAQTLPRLKLEAVNDYYLPELVNRFFDTLSLQKGISKLLLDVPAATVQILFGLILLSFYHVSFLAFGALLLIVLYLLIRLTGGRGFTTSIEESNYKFAVAGYLQEIARALATFRFAGRHSPHLDKTDNLVSGYLGARTAHFRILLFQYWTLIGLKVLVTSAMLIVGAVLLVRQQISVGQFIAAEIIILLIVDSVEKLIKSLDSVYDVLTAVEKVSKVIEKPREDEGKLEAAPTPGPMALELKNLDFGYTLGETVLHGINLVVQSGSRIVVQGPHSSGKTTLLQVLSGQYLDFGGALLVNGHSLRNYRISSYRERVGLRLSMHGIFEGSLWENITVGRADVDVDYVLKLAAIVALTDFIDTHPDGLNMQLKPIGMHLSGRIIRSVLLLRALAHKPALLLLEDPCQELPAGVAAQVQQLIMHDLPDTTVIVVSNDPAYHATADAVYAMDDGRLSPITH